MSYEIIKDYNQAAGSDYISVSPYWLVLVLPLYYPVTYKRDQAVINSLGESINGASFSKDISKAVKLKDPILLMSEVQSVTVSSSKSNHVGTMNATLFPHAEFVKMMNPGDYVFCWMVNGEQKKNDLIRRLTTSKEPCNEFSDGLKFYGKIASIREQLEQSPDGTRYARFNLNATSFTELDATFFYEEHLATKKEGIATQLKQLNLDIDKLFDVNNNSVGMIPNQTIVQFIDVFLGIGVKSNLESGQTASELKSTYGAEGDYAHIVPANVGRVFAKQEQTKSVLRTADIIEVLHGIQNYGRGAGSGSNDLEIAKSFQPAGTQYGGSRRFTGKDLIGRNSPIPPTLSNAPLWSILQEYLNPCCNEMYSTLRINADGVVVPTVVVRQMPFNTDAYAGKVAVTPFREVPQWVVPDVIVRGADIGKSDAMRFNFIHVYGVSDTVGARSVTEQMIDAPPRFDEMDIARSGLRPYMTMVPCWVNETRDGSGPKIWTEVISDFIMGQHMTLTGTLKTYGIQSPICIGDNVKWDDVIYHIEMVTHSCSIGGDGRKTFETTLGLTHGLANVQFSGLEETDIDLYARAGVGNRQESTYLPTLTVDEGS